MDTLSCDSLPMTAREFISGLAFRGVELVRVRFEMDGHLHACGQGGGLVARPMATDAERGYILTHQKELVEAMR